MLKKQRIWKPKLFRLGLLLTLLVAAVDWLRLLDGPEYLLYDARAKWFQHFQKPPTDRLVHIDIDDASLKEFPVGWPWPRAYLAQIIDELSLAKPKVIALDMYFPEKQDFPDGDAPPEPTTAPSNDQILADSIRRAGNVLLPISIEFEQRVAPDELLEKVKHVLSADLELEASEVTEKLTAEGVRQSNLLEEVTRRIRAAREAAMTDRLERELAGGNRDLEQLEKKLVPKSTAAGRRTDAVAVLQRLYPTALAIEISERQRLQLRVPMPLINAPEEKFVNILPLAQAARYSGFVDLPPSNEGKVRKVPLLVKYRGLPFPHMALTLACAMLDVDPKNLVCTDDSIIISPPHRAPITVPVHTEQSAVVGRVGALMSVPYFGTSDWVTMYDFPNHQTGAAHLPIRVIWSISQLANSIKRNNAMVDRRLAELNEIAEPASAKEYLKHPAELSDTETRAKVIDQTLKELEDLVSLSEILKKPPPLADVEQQIVDAVRPLKQIPSDNREAALQVAQKRLSLRNQLQGRAVLMIWTAEGRGDFYPTSLHTSCPGGVIQGAIVNAILTGDMWRKAPRWMDAMATIVVGVLTTLLVALLPPWRALFFTLLLAASYALANGLLLFDYHNLILGAAGPFIACLLVFLGLTLINVITEARERRRIRKQFTSYIDPAIVNFYEEHPDIDGAAGQRREMTVVFTDLAGFTTISEKLGESTVNLLNRYFGLMVPAIRDNKGVVNKFLGDGLMFFFNAPDDNPNHATDAVQSVLSMRKVLEDFNEKLRVDGLPPVGMRAGMTTGQMIVGDAGSRAAEEKHNANDYTVLGDKVNLAARLEGANKVFGSKLLMNQETRDQIGDRFLCRKIGRIQVKGKTEHVMCHEAICVLSEATPEQLAHAEVSTEIVDTFQAGEFDRCQDLCDELETKFGDGDFAEAYRDECAKHLARSFKGEFTGQIVLSEK
jgi:class 3 adenylate cyclase/CHASE2 domain-containing sensor protein